MKKVEGRKCNMLNSICDYKEIFLVRDDKCKETFKIKHKSALKLAKIDV